MVNIPQNLPQEITDKYRVERNSFLLNKIKNVELDSYTNQPKDEIDIILGDDKQPDTFVPQIKFERWSNEINTILLLLRV